MDIFSDLTPKQATFCDEYFKDFNATKAALRAGYSEATALSGNLMLLPKIKFHLQQRGAAAAEQAQVTQLMLLAELKKIAFASMGSYFGADGKMKPLDEVDEDTKSALLNYTVTEDKHGTTTIKIRMNNKLSALDKIAKHLKFYDAQHPAHDVKYWILDGPSLDEQDRYDDDSFDVGGRKSEDGGLTSIAIGTEEELEKRVAEAVAETEARMRLEFEERMKAVEEKFENTHFSPPLVLEQGARNKEQGQEVSVEERIAEARAEAIAETEKRMCDELGDEWMELAKLCDLAGKKELKKAVAADNSSNIGPIMGRDKNRYVNGY